MLTIVSLLAMGCSVTAPQSSSPAPTPSAPIKIKVGSLQVAGAAQLLAAQTLGYFEEEGLIVEVQKLGGGAEAMPLLEQGDLNFAFANHVSWIQAVSKGFDVIAVAGINSERTQEPWTSYLMVRKDSGIDSLKKLEGKTIVVNNLNNFAWLYANKWLEQNGVDPKKVKFLEMPYPTMPDALLNGVVDAIVGCEPFGTVLMQTGKIMTLGTPFELNPGMPISVYAANKTWAEANPEAVNAFARAISKTGNLLQNDLEEQYKHIEAYTGMKPEVIRSIVLEDLHPELKLKHMQFSMDLMVEYGLLTEPVDLNKVIWKDSKIAQ